MVVKARLTAVTAFLPMRRSWDPSSANEYVDLEILSQLEMLEQAGASPLLRGEEAVSLIRNAKREVGVLS